MKDLIKKILKESDELGWIRNVPLFNDEDMSYYIDLIGLNETEKCEIQQKILDMGIYWSSSGNVLKIDYCGERRLKAYVIEQLKLNKSHLHYEVYNSFRSNLIKIPGRTLLNNNLNESNDEWDWAREVPLFSDEDMSYYIDIYNLSVDDRCELQQKILDMGIHWHRDRKSVV